MFRVGFRKTRRSAMHMSQFGLREDPFEPSPAGRYYYTSPSIREIFDGIFLAAVAGKRLIGVTGEAGVGKTSLLERLVERLAAEGMLVLATRARPGQTVEDLITQAAHGQSEGRAPAEFDVLVEALERRLEEAGAGLLVIDDAHHLDGDTLADLVELAGTDTETGRHLQVLLAGLPELQDALLAGPLAATLRNIGALFRLTGLAAAEIAPYLAHRLRQAGAARSDLFTQEAVARLARLAQGHPARLNHLAGAALALAQRHGAAQVSAELVDEAAGAHDREPAPRDARAGRTGLFPGRIPAQARSSGPRHLHLRTGLRVAVGLGAVVLVAGTGFALAPERPLERLLAFLGAPAAQAPAGDAASPLPTQRVVIDVPPPGAPSAPQAAARPAPASPPDDRAATGVPTPVPPLAMLPRPPPEAAPDAAPDADRASVLPPPAPPEVDQARIDALVARAWQ